MVKNVSKNLGIKTLDDVQVENKTVLVRVDFNSPIDPATGKILDDSRIRMHAEKTIRELVNKKAKTVLMAHQGRKGSSDFVSLQEHAKVLSSILGLNVKFVDDIFGEKAKNAIRNLSPGEVLLLENVRFWDGETKKAPAEEHAKSEMVRELAPLIDVYVVDAFAAAHRLHVSMVGFAPVVKEVVIGRVMEAELTALKRVREHPEHPCVYILGGAKAEDAADVAKAVLSQGIADAVLTGGLVANLFLYAKEINIGDVNREVLAKKGFLELLPKIKELLAEYGDNILLPQDLAIDIQGKRKDIPIEELPTEYLIKDIGERTANDYGKIISTSKTVVMNGPMGVFEEEPFSIATRIVFEAMTKNGVFSLIGGGHTLAAAKKLGFIDKVSFVSSGGGALMEYLSKGKLPVIEELKKYGGK